MNAVAFEPWPKIARLNRDILVTEKIDGTNAAVLIVPLAEVDHIQHADGSLRDFFETDGRNIVSVVGESVVFAQSRSRFIVPGRDNYGFAAWVRANAEALVATLGYGRHFGEWFGSGVQRGYGLTGGERRLALFNVRRWGLEDLSAVPGLGTVPILYEGAYSDEAIEAEVARLRRFGSVAAPGFARPEGVVVWHDAARVSFKVTLEGDAAPKGPAGHAKDEEASK